MSAILRQKPFLQPDFLQPKEPEQQLNNNRSETVLQGWKDLNSAPTTNLALNFFDILKKQYPSHAVVQTNPEQCDLIGYANAGFAETFRDDEDTNWTIRIYKAPDSRLANEPKTVKDHVCFGKWVYVWKDHEYIVYRVHSGCGILQFILARSQAPHFEREDHPEAIDSLILAVGAWTRELHDEIYVFDNQRWGKDKDLYESVKGSSWDEVILNQTMKNNLIADVEGFFDNQALYKKLFVPWKRGVILHGVPGNGKTISIKALINTLSSRPVPIPSLYVKSFDGGMYVQKWAIATIFQRARNMAPCVLIFEDIDSLVTDTTRSYFLNEVDGLESNDGILMVGTTNHLGRLDPAISQRPSRFDRKYGFKVPNEEERVLYARFWRKKLEGSELVVFGEELCQVIANLTEGFSFAYLKELFVITLLGIARGATGAGDDGEDEIENENGKTTLTDDGIVVEKEDTIEGIISELQPTISEKTESAKQSETQKSFPGVNIPKHLKDNIFLKALIIQMKMLRDEMDNTDELFVAEKVPGPNRSGMGPPPPPPIPMARAMALGL